MHFYLTLLALLGKTQLFNYEVLPWMAQVSAPTHVVGFLLRSAPIFFLLYVSARRKWALLAANAAFTLVTLSLLLYFRGFGTLPSMAVFGQAAGGGSPVLAGALSLLRPSDALYVLDLLILARMPWHKAARVPLLVLAMMLFLGAGWVKMASIPKMQAVDKTLNFSGPLGYALAMPFIDVGPLELTPQDRQRIETWLAGRPPEARRAHFGRLAGRDLVLLHVESLETFVLGRTTPGGELVAPNLTRMAAEGLFFPNLDDLVREGVSSDSYLMVNTGLLPVRAGGALSHFSGSAFPGALPRALGERGYQAAAFLSAPAALWNWQVALGNLGYERRVGLELNPGSEILSYGAIDGDFLPAVGQQIAQMQSPWVAYVVTGSSHMPYQIPERLKSLSLPPSRTNDYLQAMHYVDAAIGEMRKALPEDAVLAIYGDHRGLHRYFPEEAEPGLPETLPLIIVGRGIEPKRVETLGGQVDIHSTLKALWGLERGDAMGFDLLSGRGTALATEDALWVADRYIRGNYRKGATEN